MSVQPQQPKQQPRIIGHVFRGFLAVSVVSAFAFYIVKRRTLEKRKVESRLAWSVEPSKD